MTNLIILKDPTKFNYLHFLNHSIARISETSPSSIDIYISTPIHDTAVLNHCLTNVYHLAREAASEYVLEDIAIDVIFNSPVDQRNYSAIYVSKTEVNEVSVSLAGPTVVVDDHVIDPASGTSLSELATYNEKQFGTVAVGGTFDHLHDGHKILLSLAIFVSKKLLIVGVTGEELLKNKKYKEYLESYETRVALVTQFLRKLDSNIPIDVYKIEDICGPTGYVADIDALVVSAESRSGGKFVNNTRKEKGFKELEIVQIDVVGGGEEENQWSGKLSSTEIRKRHSERNQK